MCDSFIFVAVIKDPDTTVLGYTSSLREFKVAGTFKNTSPVKRKKKGCVHVNVHLHSNPLDAYTAQDPKLGNRANHNRADPHLNLSHQYNSPTDIPTKILDIP